MKKRSLSLAAALALTLAAAGGAQAATHVVVLNPPTAPGDTTPFTGSFTDTLASGGSFTEDFLFSGPPPVASDTFSATAGSGITFTGVSLSYGLGVSAVPVTIASTVTSSSVSGSTLGEVDGGLYDLRITGTATAGSAFTGNISALVGSVSSVPEPASSGLMLLGLAALGLAARRRRG